MKQDDYFVVSIEFDNCVVKGAYPKIGEDIPNCIAVLKKLQELGMKIVLNTTRSDSGGKNYLTEAVIWLNERGVELYGINENPSQTGLENSPKIKADINIDPISIGCPLMVDNMEEHPYVDWERVGKLLLGDKLYSDVSIPEKELRVLKSYKIDKDTLLPKNFIGRKVKHTFRDMKVGDSLFMPNAIPRHVYIGSMVWRKRETKREKAENGKNAKDYSDWKFYAEEDVNKSGEKGARLWRVK